MNGPSLWSGTFWKAAIERSVKTAAQTLAALLVTDGTGLLDSAWVPRLSVAGMAALVSLLTSIGSDAATGTGPSLVDAEVLNDGLEPAPVETVYSSDPKADAAYYDARHDKEN